MKSHIKHQQDSEQKTKMLIQAVSKIGPTEKVGGSYFCNQQKMNQEIQTGYCLTSGELK